MTRFSTLALLAMAFCGCATVDVDYQRPYSPELMASIRPGVTTRAQVIRLLGPPEEMRRLAQFERSIDSTPQERRVLEARDLFTRDAYTYVHYHKSIDVFGLLPIGPAIFRVSRHRMVEDRWHIEFDESDVVRSLSHVDEGAAR